jgi:hypothetical protein
MEQIPDIINDPEVGNHQMTIVGWTTNNEWIVINSWGNTNGYKGLFYIPFGYKYISAIALSDKIYPTKRKSKNIIISVDKNTVNIDGEDKEASFKVVDGKLYVGSDFITDDLGTSVEWKADKNRVILRSEEALIKFNLGDKVIDVDGSMREVQVPSLLIDGKPYISMDVISRLNYNTSYDEINRIETITSL